MTTSSSDTPPTPERKLPATIGPYFIESELGSGGMGTVYLGRHKETDEFVAVKLLPASMAREAGFVARFEREIAAMKQLKNAHIVELFESGEDNESYYYTMEYVKGETLAGRLERDGRIPWREAIEIGVQICTALKSAHNAGIIHRDLKPSNLLLNEEGVVKLTDFGVAQVFATGRLTVTGGVLGTAEYMSPEQAQGKRASKQSDIYSLGAVMYVMLTGRPPFTGKTALDIIQKHRFAQFDSVKRVVPEVPFWLDEIVCKCLSKKPEDRYPDAYVLSLRLAEVSKKIDMQQQAAAKSELEGTAETIVDAGDGIFSDDEVGGTLVRDLFRAQLDTEQSAKGFTKLFDNVWVLIGVLVLLAGGAYSLSVLNTPSQAGLYERGVELMSRPEGLAWEAAKRENFDKLLELDEERWQPKVAPYLKEIEVYELRKSLLGRSLKQEELPESEPEAIVLQAMELRKQGRVTEARLRLIALRDLLKGDEDYQTYSSLLDQMIAETSAEANLDRLTYVEAALDRADAEFEKGEIEQALSIWFSVKKLYDHHPDARELVQRAERSYLEASSVRLDHNDDSSFMSDLLLEAAGTELLRTREGLINKSQAADHEDNKE